MQHDFIEKLRETMIPIEFLSWFDQVQTRADHRGAGPRRPSYQAPMLRLTQKVSSLCSLLSISQVRMPSLTGLEGRTRLLFQSGPAGWRRLEMQQGIC